MKRNMEISHEFVRSIPHLHEMEEGVLYISIPGMAAAHKCFCGCRSEVTTPLSPVGWELRYCGESVSLYPSIGSWSLDCQSHYWIKNDKVIWAPKLSEEAIRAVKHRDISDLNRHYDLGNVPSVSDEKIVTREQKLERSFWHQILKTLRIK